MDNQEVYVLDEESRAIMEDNFLQINKDDIYLDIQNLYQSLVLMWKDYRNGLTKADDVRKVFRKVTRVYAEFQRECQINNIPTSRFSM